MFSITQRSCAQEKRRLASMRGVPDADGFITVLPSKRSAHAAGGGGEDTEDLDELEALASGKPVSFEYSWPLPLCFSLPVSS